MHHLEAAVCIPTLGRSGRWTTTPSGSLISGWCSSSLSFIFTGAALSLSIGSLTEHKDKENGGTPMLAIVCGQTVDEVARRESGAQWRTVDPVADSLVVVFEGESTWQEETIVKLVLIDWASKFELEALVVDEDASIRTITSEDPNTQRILVIGDSISCGLAVSADQGGEPVPFGVLDTFPFVAQQILLEEKGVYSHLQINLIGHPGVNLVSPTEEEKEKGRPTGMSDMFFWTSPWEKVPFAHTSEVGPTVLLIELGTNDQAFEVAAERFRDALSDFIGRLLQFFDHSVTKVWLVPPFPDADTTNRDLNNAFTSFIPILEQRFDRIQVRVCDLVEELTTKDTVDGCHPMLATHRGIGQKLANFIRAEL